MRIKLQLGLIVVVLLFSASVYAQEASQIEIRKVEGRSEAFVPTENAVREKPTGFFGKGFYNFENGIAKTARVTVSIVGKITDTAVFGVQKVSGVLLAPIIKTLDVKQRLNKTSTPSRERI